MSKIKLELRDKSDVQLLVFAKGHVAAMNGNVNFPTPNPLAITFSSTLTAYETALTASEVADQAAKTATSAKDDKRVLLEAALNTRAKAVENDSAGDETKMLSSGFSLRAANDPIGPMTQPQNFRATSGDLTGEIDLQCDAVRGAKSYVVECRTHGAAPGAWAQVKIITKSRATISGLTPGQEYAFRIRAVGTAGEGPWSDEAVKMAPA